jgi:hypothetical protein
MNSDALVAAVAIAVAACATLLGLGLAAWISSRGGVTPAPPDLDPPLADRPPSLTDGVEPKWLPALAAEFAAHAHNAAAQAVRARAALGAARAALSMADATRTRAEAEYDAVRAAYARTQQSFRVAPADPVTEARERDVSRAALDAYRRGELPVEVLRTVFGQTDPDPERDLREREADRLAALESRARRAFQQAIAAARRAREELHVAEIADAAVQREAAEAAREAREVALAARAALPRRQRRRVR